MKSIGALAAVAALTAGAALAQAKTDVTLLASGKNPSFCTQGDGNFVKKWSVAITADQATVSGGNSLTLKKVADGRYETETTVGGTKLKWTVVGGSPLTFTVASTSGCTWEGKS